MTTTQIKRALRRNRKLGRRPWSMYQIAQMKGVHRSLIIRAVNNAARYPEARTYVEALLANGGCDKAKTREKRKSRDQRPRPAAAALV